MEMVFGLRLAKPHSPTPPPPSMAQAASTPTIRPSTQPANSTPASTQAVSKMETFEVRESALHGASN